MCGDDVLQKSCCFRAAVLFFFFFLLLVCKNRGNDSISP